MEKQTLPKETEAIYIKLTHYDDIFSDFDIRPYSDRALSVDFIDEMKRAVNGKDGAGVDLILHVPENARDEIQEARIKERLAAHFARHYVLMQKEKRSVLRLGLSMVVLGIICMILATFIVFEDPTRNLLLSFLVVFLEPAAWFLLWEGMDQLIFHSKNVNPDLNFYRKMTDSEGHVHFKSFSFSSQA